MAYHEKDRKENVSGELVILDGEWKVKSGYGTFPLAKNLQNKPDRESAGAWVSAIIEHKIAIDYHFKSEIMD